MQWRRHAAIDHIPHQSRDAGQQDGAAKDARKVNGLIGNRSRGQDYVAGIGHCWDTKQPIDQWQLTHNVVAIVPQAQQGILPGYEATQDEAHRYEGQTDEQKEGITALHQFHAALLAKHLQHSDAAVGDGGPVDGAEKGGGCHKGTAQPDNIL